MAKSMVVIYGGVDARGAVRPALTITKGKHLKLAKSTAKKRELNCVEVDDAKMLKTLGKLEVKDGFQDKGENGFIMVPFANAQKFLKVVDLVADLDHVVESKLTKKAIKTATKSAKAAE